MAEMLTLAAFDDDEVALVESIGSALELFYVMYVPAIVSTYPNWSKFQKWCLTVADSFKHDIEGLNKMLLTAHNRDLGNVEEDYLDEFNRLGLSGEDYYNTEKMYGARCPCLSSVDKAVTLPTASARVNYDLPIAEVSRVDDGFDVPFAQMVPGRAAGGAGW
jgi:hypothetical protein